MARIKLSGIIVVLAALAEMVVPFLLFTDGFNGSPMGEASYDIPNDAVPAGYAFSIWWPIFLFALFSAVSAARPAHRDDPGFARIIWWMAVTYAGAALWMVVARYGPYWATVPIIWFMLVCVVTAFLRAVPFATTPLWQRGIVPGLALYAGWLTAAAWINAADVLPDYGFGPFGLSPQAFGACVIVAIGLTALAILRASHGNLVYAGTLVWALVAIIVKAAAMNAVAITALVALGVVVLATALIRGRA